MKRLFISRQLSAASAFHSLDSKCWKITDKALITINSIDFKDEPETSWIFFYSKNGVNFYFNKRPFSESIKYAVMGPGTASAFKSRMGTEADFIGNGDPEPTALEFQKNCSDESVLFVKALNSRNSVYNLLPKNIEKYALDVYENRPLDCFELESCDCLIFTSPLNAKAYFSKYPYNQEVVLSIGATTAHYIIDKYGICSEMPDEASEKGLFDLFVKKLKI